VRAALAATLHIRVSVNEFEGIVIVSFAMRTFLLTGILVWATLAAAESPPFPPELIDFEPYAHNPVFAPGEEGAWDERIRERGWILKEDGVYHMWYTGYQPPESSVKHLGYATSTDGIEWTRHPDNPIHTGDWVEDMMVVKVGDTYYMFAEGEHDRAHMLSSTDRIRWTGHGPLDIRMVDGSPIPDGPYGTPTVFLHDGTWYLFYERDDDAIWLAASTDFETWTHVQDDPVIRRGPEPYDRTMIALNQIVEHDGRFYAYYHGTCPEFGSDRWSVNVAVSDDLIHWEKYPGNPIIDPDQSSGILVHDGESYRMYCMHRAVHLFLPREQQDDAGTR